MAGQVGSPMLLLGVWLMAGVLTLLGALTNAEGTVYTNFVVSVSNNTQLFWLVSTADSPDHGT